MAKAQLGFFDGKISLRDNAILISLVFTGILVASSFLPLFQVILLEVFKIYELLSSALGIGLSQFIFPTYSIISLIVLHQFYKADTLTGEIVTNILAVLFFYPLLMLLIRLTGYDSSLIFFSSLLWHTDLPIPHWQPLNPTKNRFQKSTNTNLKNSQYCL